ncbi:MAG: EI24 domain-containing protein [Bacteroidia bacterium]|nr:EI24 domain-containing protein [Bacteroidia bacterium]
MFNLRQWQAGFSAFFRATPFLFNNGMGWWYLVPVLLYFVLFLAAFFGFSQWASPYIENWVASRLNISLVKEDINWWQSMRIFLTKSTIFLSGWIIKLLIISLLSKIMKYAILIIMSPVLAYISEKTEAILTNGETPFDLVQFLKDVARGVFFALRSLTAELSITLGLGIIGFFIPIVFPFIPLFIFIVNCFYIGVSLMDYVAERRKLSVRQSMVFMRKNKGTLIGVGCMFNLIYQLPFIGIVVAPINGAVAAVLAQNKVENKEHYSTK